MASDYDACGPVPFEAPHRTKPGLEAPVVSLDPVVGILGGVVQCGRQEGRDLADQAVGPVTGDLSRLTVRADPIGEVCCRSPQITLPGHEHVDDLPVLVNGPIDVPPGPGDLHVSLIDKPVTTHDVAARPSRVDEQGREPLNPPEQGQVVNLDTALSEQLPQIPVGQSVT